MSHHALMEYVRRGKEAGASDEDIAVRLCAAGWYRIDVQDALELYRTMTRTATLTSAPIPTQKPAAPRTYDPFVIVVAAVSFSLAFLGYLVLR